MVLDQKWKKERKVRTHVHLLVDAQRKTRNYFSLPPKTNEQQCHIKSNEDTNTFNLISNIIR